MLKTFFSRYSKYNVFSQNIHLLFEILSKIVVKKLEIMLMVIAVSKLYPACQMDENGIKPGNDLNTADKRVAEPSVAEFLGIK